MRPEEKDFDRKFGLLTTDLSVLRRTLLLLELRADYEYLHPETKHGGHRSEQAAKMAAWPSFSKYLERTGLWSERTAQRHLEQAEYIQGLGTEIIAECNGSILANKLGILVRLTDVGEPHRLTIVQTFRSSYADGLKLLKAHEPTDAKTSEDGSVDSKSEEKFTREEDESEEDEPTEEPRMSEVSGEAEYRLRSVKEGHEAIVEFEGRKARVLVTADLKFLVLAPIGRLAATEVSPKPLRKAGSKPAPQNDPPLTPSKMKDAVSRAVGNAGPPMTQVHGTDVMFKVGARKWTLSWWPRKEATGKVEVSHLSAGQSVGTVCGPLTLTQFEQHLLQLLSQVQELGS